MRQDQISLLDTSDWINEIDDQYVNVNLQGGLCLLIVSARSGNTQHRRWLLSHLRGAQRRRLERMIDQTRTPSNDLMFKAVSDLMPRVTIEEIESIW